LQSPPIPKNEIQRLIALKQYQILDTLGEESFDDLTSLASQICNTPIALITLLDESRQWFKSAVGIDATQTAREVSFCGHAILNNEIFEIPNVLKDDRFSDNPLVTGDPNIRFYAGIPLITQQGYALGTLCVIDRTARKLTPEQRQALKKLGRQVVMQIEHRLSMMKIADMASMLERTGEIAKIGGWENDLETNEIMWTKEVFRIHEIEAQTPPPLNEVIAFYAPEAQIVIRAAVANAISMGQPWDLELPFITAKGRKIWVRTQGNAVIKGGRTMRLAGTFQDITERKKDELDLAWLNRALLMLSKCNETLIHLSHEHNLIVEVCRIAVDIGGYRMAWVGYAEHDDYQSIKPKAHFGHANHFLEEIKLSWSEDHPNGRGPGGKSLRSGQAVMVEDLKHDSTYPAQQLAIEQGYRGMISLPLQHKHQTFGVLVMYSAEPRIFAQGEISLLQELADNLAAGIINIRVEQERQQLHNAMLMVANAVSQSIGQSFFPKLLSNVIEALGAQAGYIAQFLTQKPWKARTIAVQVDGATVDNFDYAIPDVIADNLFVSDDVRIERQHVARDYPDLVMLRFYPYQAFAALRLIDSSGNPIGLMFVFFKEPLTDYLSDVVSSMLKIFATRTASELERLKDEAIIHEQASLLEKTNDAIVVRDMEHRITFWNQGAQALYGWTSEEALGQPIQKLLQHPPAIFRRAVNAVLKAGQWTGEVVERHKNGEQLTIESHWTLVKDEMGQPKSIFAIKTDISDRKLAEEQIKQLAFYDPLTKLPNRRLLMDRLEKALSATRRKKLYGALIFIDLDNFKSLNDTLGHDKGDLFLQEVAARLKRCVRDCDTVARLGGDEFVIMVEDLNGVQAPAISLARIIGQKVLNELNYTFDFDDYQHLSKASIGIALFNHHTKDVDELIKQADIAMYKSKNAGRNRLTFYQ